MSAKNASAWCAQLGLALTFLVTVSIVASHAQTLPKGHVICPVIGEGARLIKGCSFEYRSATKLGSAKKTAIGQCPSGSFHDPRNGGECWSCPSGFLRTMHPVFADNACWKAVSEDLQHAKKEANPVTSCPSGSFHDPRNGGECWSCPSGYSRTWDPVTSATACHQYVLGPTARANFVTKFGCPSGTFWDPLNGGTCWSCPSEYRRTLHPVTSAQACAKTIPTQYASAEYVSGGCEGFPVPTGYSSAFFDPIDYGTCWSCPVMFERSLSPVNTDKACHPGSDVAGFVWQSPQYPEPGVYHFLSREVLEHAFADPKAVDAFISNRAGGDATKKKELWDKMIVTPGLSPEFKTLALAAILTMADQGAKTIDGSTSVTKFETYIRNRRMFIAQDTKDMYDAWLGIDSYNMVKAARASSGISGAGASLLGSGPPDFATYAWAAAAPDRNSLQFLEAMYAMGQMASTKALRATPSPEAYSFNTDLLGPVFFALDKAIGAWGDWALTLKNLGSMLGHVAGSMGAGLGLIAVQQSVELVNSIITLTSKEEAARAVNEQVTEAAKPVNLKSLYQSDDGKSTILLFWALATSPYGASDKVQSKPIDEATSCSTSSGACRWTQWRVAQASRVASAESISAYQRHAANLATEPPMFGSEIRLTQGPGQPAPSTPVAPVNFVVDPSNITIMIPGAWNRVSGALADLSAGPDGPWGVNSYEQIWRYKNGNWEMLPGGAVTVSVGPTGEAWVVNSAHQPHRWNPAKNNWDLMPGGVTKVSVGPSSVWGVNQSNQIWRYANNQWQQMPGSAVAVAVSPRDEVWALGTTDVAGGKNVMQWSASTNSWTTIPGGLVQISAASGALWGVNNTNNIFKYEGGGWTTIEGTAKAVSIGPGGDVWGLATESVNGGHPVVKRY